MVIKLKIRDIRTGDAQVAEFESVAVAEQWLRERPAFTEVLGPASPGMIPAADETRLRAALRPFDPEELMFQAEQDERDDAVMREAMAAEEARMLAEMEARREANRKADPDRPMQVAWERGKGLRNSDPTDERTPTQAIHDAVAAWVAERETWVSPRGKYLVGAQVVAWPGPLPAGTSEDERVQPGGRFDVLVGTPPELN